ncbi:MAG: hypothetical protein ACRDBO_10785 [Lachnospiraceae bacterium]
MSFATQMLDMLTSAYDRTDIAQLEEGEQPQTVIGKLFALSGWGFDLFKDQADKVKLWDDLDQKQGRELDRYGKDFGVTRGGSTDEVYRLMIKVKTISLLASGNLDSVILATASLFGVDASDVEVDEIFPAKIYLYINEDRLDEAHKNIADAITGLLSRIKSAGVGIRIFYRTYHTETAHLYLATTTMQMVQVKVDPVDSDTTMRVEAPLLLGVAALEYIKVAYAPQR